MTVVATIKYDTLPSCLPLCCFEAHPPPSTALLPYLMATLDCSLSSIAFGVSGSGT